jgi:hypothetical protein
MKKQTINKMYSLFAIVLLILLGSGCRTSLNYKTNGDINDAINNVILNFINNNHQLLKNDAVFNVVFFEEENDKNDYYKLIIIGTENQHLYNKLKKPNDNRFPSNYTEVENKLFLWYDDTKKIDSLTISTYKRYNLLINDKNGSIKYLDSEILDDSKKGVIYFVCKNNLTKFEKHISNKSIKYPKKLKCTGTR